MKIKNLIIIGCLVLTFPLLGQNQSVTDTEQISKIATPKIEYPEFQKKLNESGSHYIKTTMVAQIWTRYTDFNPGTTLNGFTNQTPFDIGNSPSTS